MPEGRITLTTTPVLLAETTKGRKNLRFLADPANTANIAIHHKKEVTTTGLDAGIILTPGSFADLNEKEDKDINDSWWGVAASGTQYCIVNMRL